MLIFANEVDPRSLKLLPWGETPSKGTKHTTVGDFVIDRQTDRIFIDVKSPHGLICHRKRYNII